MLSGACPRPWSRIFYLYLIYTIWLQFIVLSLFTVYFVRKERTLLQEQDFVPNLLLFIFRYSEIISNKEEIGYLRKNLIYRYNDVLLSKRPNKKFPVASKPISHAPDPISLNFQGKGIFYAQTLNSTTDFIKPILPVHPTLVLQAISTWKLTVFISFFNWTILAT